MIKHIIYRGTIISSAVALILISSQSSGMEEKRQRDYIVLSENNEIVNYSGQPLNIRVRVGSEFDEHGKRIKEGETVYSGLIAKDQVIKVPRKKFAGSFSIRISRADQDITSGQGTYLTQEELRGLRTVNIMPDNNNRKDYVNVVFGYDFTGYKCPICFGAVEEGEKVAVLPCGHSAHSECLEDWLITNPICPECRKEGVEYKTFDAVATTEQTLQIVK